MEYGRFDSLEELIESINIGLDIEFILYGTRYNISPSEDTYFICVCPNGDAIHYKDGNELVSTYSVNGKPLKSIWQDIQLRSM